MAAIDDSMREVQRLLGHVFGDPRLLADALTHSSFANEKPKIARGDNEVLEFMGDAVLQWAVSSLLLQQFPEASAGELTRRRADLVCEEGLAELARALEIGAALRLGKGEDRTGGRDKPRLLASAFEACVAAVYLDSDPQTIMAVCRRLFEPRLEAVAPGQRDFKTRVQEAAQRAGIKPPRYALVSSSGPDHDRVFEVEILIDGTRRGLATGRSKLEAEQAAAAEALSWLELEGDNAD